LKKLFRDYAILFFIALIIIALDQWTKTLIRTNLDYSQIWLPQGWEWLYPYFHIVHWYNKGAAFGLFQNGSMVFTILAIVISVLIIYYYPRLAEQDKVLRIALGMQLGGAIGNLIDRILFGHVTDFIAVGDFPVFNVADASITIGVFIIIVDLWFKEQEGSKEIKEQGENKEIERLQDE